MGESFFLTKEVVGLAVERVLLLVKICEKEDDYQNQGLSICTIKDKEILFCKNVGEKSWPAGEDYEEIAKTKTETSFREKKDLSTLLNEYYGRLEPGDPIYPGAVYSSQYEISIGVSGCVKAESDEGIARLILSEIKKIVAVRKRTKFEELKESGRFFLE